MILLSLSLLIFCILSFTSTFSRDFKLDSHDAFKLVVFSDLYMSNNPLTYNQTKKLVADVMKIESPVDLVVLLGDTVDPKYEDSFTSRFAAAVEELVRLQVPWVSTGGEDIPGNAITREYMIQKEKIIGGDQNLSETAAFQTPDMDNAKMGLYTQKIAVQNTENNKLAFNIWIMDSLGGYDCYGNSYGKSCVSKEAVAWFKSNLAQESIDGPGDFVFTTYPTQEFMTMLNYDTASGFCNQKVCCQASNTGLFDAARDSKKVGWIVAGGDSDNDFKGLFSGITLAYGRKSGFGGNGKLKRGARVFKVNVEKNIYWIQSWIRDEDGKSITQSNAGDVCQKGPEFKPQTQCCQIYGYDNSDNGNGGEGEIVEIEVEVVLVPKHE